MSQEWIKVRSSLITSPKVNLIAKYLSSKVDVTRKLAPGFDGRYHTDECDYMSEIVTSNVMRCVTVTSLVTVWGAANEHTSDGVFQNSNLTYIDDITGIPFFGEAMALSGWAVYDKDSNSITLPNFNEYNTSGKERSASAKTGAERQREYRDRKRNENITKNDVTSDVTNDVTSNRREEKRREDLNTMSGKPSDFSLPLENPTPVVVENPQPVIAKKSDAAEVIDFLNAKTGSKFQLVEANTKLVIARLNGGATVDLLKRVIEAKVVEWGADAKMRDYLRPATLFNAEKFAQYSGQLSKGDSSTPFDLGSFMKNQVGA